MQRLDQDQLDAVIGHETAHHRARHWRYIAFAVAVERGLRPLRFVASSVAVLRHSLEVWADDEAADGSPKRRADLHSALMVVAGTDPCGMGVGAIDRTRRVTGAPPRSALNLALHRCPIAIVAGVVMIVTLGWAGGVHHFAAATDYSIH